MMSSPWAVRSLHRLLVGSLVGCGLADEATVDCLSQLTLEEVAIGCKHVPDDPDRLATGRVHSSSTLRITNDEQRHQHHDVRETLIRWPFAACLDCANGRYRSVLQLGEPVFEGVLVVSGRVYAVEIALHRDIPRLGSEDRAREKIRHKEAAVPGTAVSESGEVSLGDEMVSSRNVLHGFLGLSVAGSLNRCLAASIPGSPRQSNLTTYCPSGVGWIGPRTSATEIGQLASEPCDAATGCTWQRTRRLHLDVTPS